ncbi:MAG: hypothetical protein AAF327_12175, partial [Cyanobacteria bacterium P01_A01_bin.37]
MKKAVTCFGLLFTTALIMSVLLAYEPAYAQAQPTSADFWSNLIHLSNLKGECILKIRHSTESDRVAISAIHRNAFGEEQGQEIVALVEALLNDETATPV